MSRILSPIEKAKARAAALGVLGLDVSATEGEIRDAWRRAAFETHPDRTGGDHTAFARVKAAYDTVRAGSGSAGALDGPEAGTVRAAPAAGCARPTVATRVSELSPTATAACRALLDEDGDAAGADRIEILAAAGDPGPDARDAGSADHIPDRIRRSGRRLTYLVGTPLARGENRVALPTAQLEGSRKVEPCIVAFSSAKAGAGEIAIPDDVRARLFPGARSVRILFAEMA